MKKLHCTTILLIISICVLCESNLPADQLFNRGKEVFQGKNSSNAYTWFSKAAKKDPENASYQWAAAKTAPNPNMAFIHTKAAWDNGMKTAEVLYLLTDLSFQNDKKGKLSYALSLYDSLPGDRRSLLLRSDIFEKFGQYDSSLTIRRALFDKTPTPELSSRIAFLYGKKGQPENAKTFLETCRNLKLLDSEGYILYAYFLALDYEYDKITPLFADARKLGFYTNKVQLEHAGFLLVENKLKEAEKLLVDLFEPATNNPSTPLNQQARIMASYVYRAENDTAKIRTLISKVPDSVTNKTSEIEYYTTLSMIITDSTTGVEQLKECRKKLPGFPIIDLIYARENAMRNRYEPAVAAYSKLPQIFKQSPRVGVEFAVSLAKIGKYDEALGLIQIMHKKERFTKNSLELFRDITAKKQLVDKSAAAQKILEKQYPEDVGVQYTSAMLALKKGETDKALSQLTKLAKKYPAETQFELARISVYMIKEDYPAVVEECNKSKLESFIVAPLKARALIKLGKNAEAESLYLKTIQANKNKGIMVEYAQFLISGENFQQAIKVYQDFLTSYANDLEKDKKTHALILNNLAWALLKLPGSDKKEALAQAQKAHTLVPEDISILDTYCTALLENKKYRECIKILEPDTHLHSESKLLYLLANAYEKLGDTNKAVRTYQEILETGDAKATIPAPEKKLIKQKISQLNSL